MIRKPNFANVLLSMLVLMTMMLSAAQPGNVSASTAPMQGDGIERGYHPQTGKLSFLGADPVNPIRVGKAMERGLSPEARGLANLQMYAGEFGIQDVERELSVMRSSSGDGREMVRYQQMFNGIPVMAGELNVNMQEDGSLLSINGEVSPELDLDTRSRLTGEAAKGVALQAIAEAYNLSLGDLVVSEPELWIFDERLMQEKATQPIQLVWRMEISSENAPLRELVLVNAETGRISLHFNQVDTAWEGEAPLALEPESVLEQTTNLVEESAAEVPPNEQLEIAPEAVNITTIPDGSLYVSTNGSDTNDCLSTLTACKTISAAIAKLSDGQTIAVADGVYKEWVIFPHTGTVRSYTLTGGWDETFTAQIGRSTIDGENIRRGLEVTMFLTLLLDHFIIQNGYSSDIWSGGGGILNGGTLTIQNSTIHNNKADGYGGGIFSSGGSNPLTIINSTIANNDGTYGGGISGGKVIVRNSTFAYNSASYGGAFNHTGYEGTSSANLGNVTFVGNTARIKGGTLYANGATGRVYLENTILAGAANGACAYGTNPISNPFISKGHNLFNQTCSLTLLSTDKNEVNPKLGSFLPVQGYVPLRSDSPAVNAGYAATCYGTRDQRGQLRVGTCDIGAFEYVTPGAAASIWAVSGNLQNTIPNRDFPLPLVATVLDGGGNPVPGVPVTLETPAAGPSALFVGTGTTTQTVTTNIAGNAVSSLLSANSEYGPLDVSASFGGGASQPVFSIEILRWSVTPTGSDSNSCKSPAEACQTIQAAISKAYAGDTIYVAEGTYTSSGAEVVFIADNTILSGGWNDTFDVQTGYSTIDGENTRRGVRIGGYPRKASASISRFIISHGKTLSVSGDDGYGAGIFVWDGGTLTLTNSILSNNSAASGGGIYAKDGTVLVIRNCVIKENYAGWSTSYGGGGGMVFAGKLTMSGSSVYDNFALGGAGGISAGGIGTISNSTIARNRTGGGGGGISAGTYLDGDMVLNNVTITENFAAYSGGVGGDLVLTNSILANNHSLFENGVEGHNGNCDSSQIKVKGRNIIYPWCPVAQFPASPIIERDPRLGKFIPELGYAPIQIGSPAINNGTASTCATGGDQRGQARVGICDLGAFEYVTNAGVPNRILAISGGEQRVLPGTQFPLPLVAVVLDVRGNPVAGQSITFTATGATANATFANGSTTTTVATNNGGYATTSVLTANSEVGDFTVEASNSTGTVTFQLSNGAWYIVPGAEGGNDLNDCKSPATACATFNAVITKPDFYTGDIVQMKRGTFPALDEDIQLDQDLRINGGWDAGFTAQTGVSVLDFSAHSSRIIEVKWNGKAFFDRVGLLATKLVNRGNVVFENGFIRNGYAIRSQGYLTVRNSTITGNRADIADYGGGLYNVGITVFENSTIAENHSDWSGGGIYIYDGSVTLTNSIVIGNTAPEIPDCGGIRSNGHNLFGISCYGSYTLNYSSTDIYGDADHPILKSTVFGSGVVMDPTTGQWYYPLRIGSPALDAGNTARPGSGGHSCTATDQLGVTRPQGVYCDMGASEFQFNVSPPSPLIVTYSAGNTTSLPGTSLCSGNDATCTDSDDHVKKAHAYAYSTYAKYLEWHGRNSLDGNGMQINSTVRFGNNYRNAYWNGHMLVYGDGYGYPLADDIVAHEFTHGVTQFESNLFLWYQSGAINESFSDLWGEAVDQLNGLGSDTDPVKWLIGEDITGIEPMRSMANPPVYDDPDSMLSSLYCETGTCLDDNGGAHTNSGVNNKAAYLLVHGGFFNGRTVSALGWTKTLAIYYEAQTNLLTSGSDYLDLYNALYQACLNKIGENGIVPGDCGAVRNATLAVKMNQQPVAGFNPDTTYCPAGQAAVLPGLFYEDFESGTDRWTLSALGGRESSWELSGKNAKFGTGSLWADDSRRGLSFAETPKIRLPENSKIYLFFSHLFSFKKDSMYYYTGGVAEYALNSSWDFTDLKSLFNAGKNYNGIINKDIENALAGRSAFVGDSHGYVDTRYNISSLAGKTTRFHWAMGTGSYDYVLGWYIDEVRVYLCVSTPGVPTLTSPGNNLLLSDYTPTFDWSDSTPDLDHYELQLATDSAFTKNLLIYDDIPGSTFTPTVNLSGGTRYYWRVRAVNAADKSSAWSMARNFRTAFAGPVNGAPNGITTASRKPTFTWNAVTGATSYRIQISTSNTFMTTVVDASVTTNSFTPSINLGIGSTYYWRVMVDGGLFVPGRWSTVWSFTTP